MLCALLATLLFGSTGGIITAIIAVAAIALAVFKRIRTKKGGIAAIVIGVLAIILAIAMTNTTSAMVKTLHEKAAKFKPDGLWAQVSEDYNSGMMGIIRDIPKDQTSLKALVEEMNELNKIVEKN